MQKHRSTNPIFYLRSWVSIVLIASWSLAAFTGFLLWLAPSGPRAGKALLLFGISKGEWGDIHFWFSAIALTATLIHLIVDWRALCGCIRYLTGSYRTPGLCEAKTTRS